jgi:ATP synthase protein I
MFRVVAAQFLISIVVAGGAWLIGGHHAAVSSLLGGLACAVPNGFFALNLAWLGHVQQSRAVDGGSRRARMYALALLAGEFVKVAVTIGLLVLVVLMYRDVVWLALIVSVIAVLMMQAAALVRR